MSGHPLMITHNGETLPSYVWAKRCGISTGALTQRIRNRVPIAQAVTLGPQPKRSRTPLFTQERTRDELAQALMSVRLRWVIRRCLSWSGPQSERLDDNEIADIAAMVCSSKWVRLGVLERGGDVAHLCLAKLAARPCSAMASRAMVAA